MYRIVRFFHIVIAILAIGSVSGCKDKNWNIFAPKSTFSGDVTLSSQYQKHVWLTTGTGMVFDKQTMNPGEVWSGELNGSQLYTLHWSFVDGTNPGAFDFRPNSVQSHDAHDGYGNAMDWYIELGDGGVVNFQALKSEPAPPTQ